jgi:hypothetical protein
MNYPTRNLCLVVASLWRHACDGVSASSACFLSYYYYEMIKIYYILTWKWKEKPQLYRYREKSASHDSYLEKIPQNNKYSKDTR